MFIFLVIVFFISCEDFAKVSYLTINIPSLEQSHRWDSQRARNIFFINKARITQETHNLDERTVQIFADKTGIIPVLSCVKIDTVDFGIQQCPLALGGVFPFDASEKGLMLNPLHKAQVAQLLLLLFMQSVDIQQINVSHLYKSIGTRSPDAPFDFLKFYEYLTHGTLHSWGIKPQEDIEVFLPVSKTNWISTSFWVDNIYGVSEKLEKMHSVLLYPGKWIFVSEHVPNDILFIYVDRNKYYSISKQ